MKVILTGLMLMCLSLPINAGEEPQQSSLDNLLSNIQQKRTERAPGSVIPADEQIRRLKSELIDIRVERDLLKEENVYLRNRIDDIEDQRHSAKVSTPGECISIEDAEEQRLMQHVVYSLGLYRLAEFMDSAIPEENVEAHARAQKIMDGAKADLELLGFDTSNPEDFPTLEELLEQFEIAHEAHDDRIRTN